MKVPTIQRGMVQTALGSIFYLMSDGRTTSQSHKKPPILCFHMSPRSSDEFREVLPLLAAASNANEDINSGEGRVVIAFDLPGYGSSDNPPHSCTMNEVSDACLVAANTLLRGANFTQKQQQYVALGSLLGNYCCVSLAERHPETIRAGILTNLWYNPKAKGTTRSRDDNTPIPNSFETKQDGSHLLELHAKRSGWLDPDLNFRVVQSEMAYLGNRRERYARGVNIEGGNDYDFSSAVSRILGGNFLCIRGKACTDLFDAFGLDGTQRFENACSLLRANGDGSSDRAVRVETLEGETSTLNLVNQMPAEFAAVCNAFLSDHRL